MHAVPHWLYPLDIPWKKSPSRKKSHMNITLSQAEAAIKAAKEKSREPGTLMNIAVVDAGTNLIANTVK